MEIETPDRVIVSCASVRGFEVSAEVYEPGDAIERHVHRGPHLVIMLEGAIDETREVSRRVSAGSVTWCPHGTEHAVEFRNATSVVVLEAREDRVFEMQQHLRGVDHDATSSDPALLALGVEMRNEMILRRRSCEVAVEGLALQIVAGCARSMREGPGPGNRTIAADAQRFIDEHLAAEIGLAEIAGALGVPAQTITDAFRDVLRCSVGEYVRRRRVEVARHLLETTNHRIGEIAAVAGFFDQAHMVRLFRRAMGTTPSLYRASIRRCRAC